MNAQGHSDAAPRSRRDGDPRGQGAAMLARLIAERRLPGDIAVTCRGRTDGAGQQAIAVISAMMLARLAGCRYFHSPFVSMSHPEGTRTDWARRWERFLNLGDGETALPEDAELISLAAAIEHPAAYAGRPVVISRPLFELPDEAAARLGDSLRSDLRAKYWRSPKVAIPSHRASTGVTVAIHLRRGDVSRTQNRGRFVRDERALRQIARLRRALAPFRRPLTMNLYSEGTPGDFRAFADAGCNLHISEDAFETFHNLVTADILMGAYSSFSYLASLLSRGIVLDQRRHAPPFSNHLRRRADDDISIKQLRRALLGRMGLLDRCAYRIGRHLPRFRQ